MNSHIALVIIGRNEAKHLSISLPAIAKHFELLIYVDSGSTDDSCALAEQHGATVINLDTSVPFTAARARNAGLERVLADEREFAFIQFIDGDCELLPDYVTQAVAFLEQHPDYGMACGRRIERFPEASIFNRLCHIEWNTPVGDTDYCGGDVLVRREAIAAVGGYDATLIAGEDPELCVRLRQAGWKLRRIDADMTKHDANITRVSQWWKRHQRAGHAFAEGSAKHGKSPQKHWVKETRSNWIYGGIAITAIIASLFDARLLVLLLIFPLQIARLTVKAPAQLANESITIRLAYATDCFAAKIPQMVGQLQYWRNRLSNRRAAIIEYK